jgi:hypothetical protein
MGLAEFIESYGFHIQTVIIFVAFLAVSALLVKFVVDKGYVSGMPHYKQLVRENEGFTSTMMVPVESEKKTKEGFFGNAALVRGNQMVSEGFGGIAVGAGEPQCLRTLPDAAEVYATFMGRQTGSEQAGSDLEEFRLLLSKWGCLKKDLMSPSGIVEATRYVPYSTLHDRIPVADLAGQCNAKTLPSRDLDITFETWKERAAFLLRRLCSATNMSSSEATALERKLMGAWTDVYEIAKSQCLTYIPSGQMMLPRDAAPYSPDEIGDLGTYKGYF